MRIIFLLSKSLVKEISMVNGIAIRPFPLFYFFWCLTFFELNPASTPPCNRTFHNQIAGVKEKKQKINVEENIKN